MPDLSEDIAGVTGFRAGGVACGIKEDGAADFALIVSDRPCVTAGVFTRNLVQAAPVLLGRQLLRANAAGMRAVAMCW